MKGLDKVVEHLRKLPEGYFGRVIIMVKQGRAVHLTEERSIRLDDEQDSDSLKDKPQRS